VKLSRLGEFGIIERIKNVLASQSSDVQISIGDDAAVFKTHSEYWTVITTDALVEGVHFDLSYTPVESLGWKLMAVNISDIAAMGGIPRTAVVSLALTENWTLKQIDLLYQGIAACCKQYNCDLIGGDTVRSNYSTFLSATITGEVEPECCAKRSGAKTGDLVCITGVLGRVMVGFRILSLSLNKKGRQKAVNHFLHPEPRVQEARILVKEVGINAMIDISDGLASEIEHICISSGKGCTIYGDKIPVAEDLKELSHSTNKPSFFEAIQSGEEYELLFTISEDNYQILKKKSIFKNGLISVIGTITDEAEGLNLFYNSKKISLPTQGWDHFKNNQ